MPALPASPSPASGPGSAAADRAPSGLPRVAVLATGGTIAGTAAAPLTRNYQASGVDVDRLLGSAGDVQGFAAITGEQLCAIGSQDMGLEVWRRLDRRIADIGAADSADAFVVVHGTDTMEETAYLLDLVTPPGRPIILVGAMRASNMPSADGPGNLVEAIRVAVDPGSAGRGVLVVLNGAVHEARSARKVHTSALEAFRSWPGGPIGTASASGVQYFAPPSPSSLRGRWRLPAQGALPSVGILYAHADMDPAPVQALIGQGVAGIVLAGVGNGNAPSAVLAALSGAAAAGIPVVRSTRLGEGRVDRNVEVDDDRLGFVASCELSPQKSRLLLQLLLAEGSRDMATVQDAFAGRPGAPPGDR